MKNKILNRSAKFLLLLYSLLFYSPELLQGPEAIYKITSPNQIDYYLTPKLIPTKYICLFILKI